MHVQLTVREGGHQQDCNRVQQPVMDDHVRSSSNYRALLKWSE